MFIMFLSQITIVKQKVTFSNISGDFILFLFSDCSKEILNILIYLAKFSEIMPWTMEQKIFC